MQNDCMCSHISLNPVGAVIFFPIPALVFGTKFLLAIDIVSTFKPHQITQLASRISIRRIANANKSLPNLPGPPIAASEVSFDHVKHDFGPYPDERGLPRNSTDPFLDVLIKYHQHRTYRAGSCSDGLCFGCSLLAY